MAKKSASQEDLQALLELVARLEGDVLRITQTNTILVEALNNTWTVLDRLTGRTAILRKAEHQHDWKAVRDATFVNGEALLGYGVTEKCECGAVRSRMTIGQSIGTMEAA